MAVLEPYSADSRDFMIARALIDCSKEVIPIRLVNLTAHNVYFHSKYLLGEIHPVDAVMNLDNHIEEYNSSQCRTSGFQVLRVERTEDSDWPPSQLPEHLQDLYKRSLINIQLEAHKKELATLLHQHQDVFAKHRTDLGTCSVLKHRIDTNGAAPIQQALRRNPRAFEQEEEKYLKEQLDAGVLVPSSSAWASPVVLVRKKDGTVRWCCDFRKLNDLTVKDAYPLPRIDMCLEALGSACFFSTMDLQHGYWQLAVDEADQHKTAIITKYGLFEYAKLPMGLCNSPSSFQRCMELILRGLQWKTVLIYLDDIIVFSSTLDDHFEKLREVFQLLQSAGLKLKPAKCDLLKKEVLFLGHTVGANGIGPNPKLLAAVKEWKEPTTVKQIQQFLGLCNYYRRFVYQFSEIAAPLTRLTEKKTDFHWDLECQVAFDGLKEALCEAPILAYPRVSGLFIVDTDASNTGIGGVLSQVQENEERVIWYASKKLSRAQRQYCVTRRELLAAVIFLQEFRHYILGQEFVLRTDHNSLRWIFSFKAPQGQLSRWLEVLSQYNFKIIHREGKKHGNADALSQMWCESKTCDCYDANLPVEALPCGGCKYCTKQHEQWSDFNNTVDDIIPLSLPKLAAAEKQCRRVATRNAVKAQSQVTELQEVTLPVPNWVVGYTATELAAIQRQDPDLIIVHEWLDCQEKPVRDLVASYSPDVRKMWIEWDNLHRVEGVLYRRRIEQQTQQVYNQLIVPQKLRKEFIHLCHTPVLSGHLGIDKTVNKIQQKAYWRTLRQDVQTFIHKCSVCVANQKPKKKAKAALMDYRVGHPMDRLGLDFLGPLPVTSRGNTCILVIADYFTRWIEAYALPNQTAEVTAQTLVNEFISRYGCPLEIHTDQGRNFESDIFKELCRLLEITKTRSTPYHPASNGLVERFNQTLARMIRSYVQDHPKEWDVHLPLLTAAYRSTVHPATKFTPSYLMLGREVISPVDLTFSSAVTSNSSIPEYVEDLQSRLFNCYHLARKHLKMAAESQKKNYDTRIIEHTFQVGDLVYRRNHRAKKLEMPWLGPYIILKHIGGVLYKISDKKKVSIIHHDALRSYTAEFIPAWARKKQAQVRNSTTQIK